MLKCLNKLSVLSLVLLLSVQQSFAQLDQKVRVSREKAFVDHLTLTDDTDIIVRIAFNEAENTLAIELKSYSGLFVFAKNTVYSSAVKCSKLRPDMLDFDLTAQSGAKFTINSAFKKSLPQPVKNYIFKRWIESEGLIPLEMEYKIPADRVYQVFQIKGDRTEVGLCLRDICVLMPQKKEGRYRLEACRDLMKKYTVTIDRDYCFGKEAEIEETRTKLQNLRESYDSLRVRYPSGEAQSKESLDLFKAMKDLLVRQFEKDERDCACDSVRVFVQEYNSYVNKLSAFQVIIPQPIVAKKAVASGINVTVTLKRAQMIDQSVARWLVTSDKIERRDIERQCKALIFDGMEDIRSKGVHSAEQTEAKNVFLKAVHYYENTCDR